MKSIKHSSHYRPLSSNTYIQRQLLLSSYTLHVCACMVFLHTKNILTKHKHIANADTLFILLCTQMKAFDEYYSVFCFRDQSIA